MIHSTGSLFYSDASARALPGRMHFYKLPVYYSNGQAMPAHCKIFAPLPPFWGKLRPLPCSSFSRRDHSAGSRWEFYTAPYRTIPLGIPPNITFPPIRVVAKSALLRFPLRGKLRPLPCSSFSRRDRSAGSRWEFYTAPYRTIPLGIPPNITFPPIHSNGEWGAYSLIGLSNGRYLVLS